MDHNNVFFMVKAALAALVGGISAAFGWLGWLVLIWAGCMVMDYITGSAAAAKDGEWSSAVARAGIWHKAGMIAVVIVAALCDSVISLALANLPITLPFEYSVLILPIILIWYIFTELGSITENAVAMGAAVPAALVSLLKAGKAAVEMKFGVTDVGAMRDLGSAARSVQDFIVDGATAGFGLLHTAEHWAISGNGQYERVSEERGAELVRCFNEAKAMLMRNWGFVECLAAELVKKDTLVYEEINELYDKFVKSDGGK